MAKYRELIIYLAVFILIIAGAAWGYNYLTQKAAKPPAVTQDDSSSDSLAKAPDFCVQTLNGETAVLEDFAGKPTVLNFWATWCAPCKSEMPVFEDMYGKYGNEVNFVMINVDGGASPVAAASEFIAQNGYTFPVYADTDYSASYAYNARSIPLSVFIDKDGNILQTHVGAMDGATLENYIKLIKN